MEEQTLKELRALAKERRIKGCCRMIKEELIEALERTKNLPEGVLPVNEAQLDKWLDSLEGIPTVLKLEFKDWMDNNLVIKKRRKDPKICPHGVLKYYCVPCGGSQICIHGKQRSFCVLCGGSQICIHNKQKAFCVPCGGSQICKHNKRKGICKECQKVASQ